MVHLHLHTEYSLLDGACRIKNLIKTAKTMGQTAVAITDHGVMYGVVDFYKAAKSAGIKPIIGSEFYMASGSRFDKSASSLNKRYHLILLAENNKGYANLCKLSSLAFTEGFYTKPRIDKELLLKYSEGLICLSACLAGEIPQLLADGEYEKAVESALFYKSIFTDKRNDSKDGFYLELQDHGIPLQAKVNSLLLKLAKQTNIPLVATNDVHYITREDAKMQQILICIGTGTTTEDESKLEFATDEFYFKSEDEMKLLFGNVPNAIRNTDLIAERCNVEFAFGETKLPHFEIKNVDNYEKYFRDLCYSQLKFKYANDNISEVVERLDYEIDVITKMGFIDYFLIVADFVGFAKQKNIPVGPGRGSGAGSLAAYLLGITGIDPIKYNLLFERFLNPERVTMPDFDIDFCYVRRPEVIEYVIGKYGADHVAQIVTFGTLAARAAIRDVGRAMAIPYAICDTVAKLVPFDIHISIDTALARSKELNERYQNDNEIKQLLDMARKVEGMPRHASTHAAGVVITRERASDYVPLAINNDSVVTQFPMGTLEELGLLKIDFLGLRTLTVISDTVVLLKKRGIDIDIEQIPIEDAQVYEMLGNGHTDGVFQFESSGLRAVIAQLKPKRLEDLIALTSLYRPGPMDSIEKYLFGRHNTDKVMYKTPKLKSILDVTYGCLVYQEQVMEVFRSLAGYSFGRADIVRRAMSKKKADVMEKERTTFINGTTKEEEESGAEHIDGCVKNGIAAEIANEIFDEMSSFASYAFNKSHAAAYALIAYRTAYLKYHFPAEFMAALLSSVLYSADKVALYIAECTRIGIKVRPPHCNYSQKAFDVVNGEITFGLLAIKNLGSSVIDEIINLRETVGKFQSFFEFCRLMQGRDFNRRAVESLIKCGALDGFEMNRREMLYNSEAIISNLDSERRKNIAGQVGFFDVLQENEPEFKFKKATEFSSAEMLAMEKEATSFYISGHPLIPFNDLFLKVKATHINNIIEGISSGKNKDNMLVTLLIIVTNLRVKTTKSGSTMGFITTEDMTGSIPMIVFDKTLTKYALTIKEGNILVIKGRITLREDKDPEIIVISADLAEQIAEKTTVIKPSKTLYIKLPSKTDEKFQNTLAILLKSRGDIPVIIVLEDNEKRLKAPIKYWVNGSNSLIKSLENYLGDSNVKLLQNNG